jgi:hypothetical protein
LREKEQADLCPVVGMGYLQELVGRRHATHAKIGQAHCGTVQQLYRNFLKREFNIFSHLFKLYIV